MHVRRPQPQQHRQHRHGERRGDLRQRRDFDRERVEHKIETKTAWSIKKFAQTARRYRTVAIRAGSHMIAAEESLPTELRDALAVIT